MPGPVGDEAAGRPEAAAQLERTALAWQRTALVLAANGALLVRSSSSLGPVPAVAGGVVLAVALGVWLGAARGYRVRRGTRAGSLLAGGRGANIALTALVVTLALVNAVTAVTEPG